jgi:hypothetical protein
MKGRPLPSGLTRGLDFLIDADWTTAQALAVVVWPHCVRSREIKGESCVFYEKSAKFDQISTTFARFVC